jgi:hypothetical protein
MSPLTAWTNFYVIVGSSAGALTGLTFVVITLTAQIQQGAANQGISAFTTPTVVHFAVTLLIASLLSAPWPTLAPPAILLGLCGFAGLLYTAIVIRRQLRMEDYQPVVEDWLSYAAGPFLAFAALLVAAILLPGNPVVALFIIGGVMALLLFLGIHNAWDVTTFIVVERITRQIEPDKPDKRDADSER